MNIVIPSYKRAQYLAGKDYFTMAKYVIPESQKDEYLNTLSEDRIITIPDSEDGNIVKKRNWILNNIPRPLVMIDDDVKSIWYWEDRHNQYLRRLLPSELVNDFFERGFELAEEFGCKMWGIAQNTDDRVYLDFKPFSLTCVILGPFQGHLDHDLKFDDRMGSKEDYDMSLQQLQRYKKILRWNKFAYEGEQQLNSGGIVSFRSMDKEIEWCKAIMRKWGAKIIKYNLPPVKLTDLRNGKTQVPIRGV